MHDNIPISLSLEDTLAPEQDRAQYTEKKKLVRLSLLAVVAAILISGTAKLLVQLINLITNLSFFHRVSLSPASPAQHNYGAWVILIPAAGGLIVGLIAYYGSKAIRGHGIPEAMEQVLTNQSKIRPAITWLKPLSSAISIGSGGPFGAEGPIIATGGALGSTIGQVLRISAYERKVLLAAGATAGMSAIFGSPIAAIFLAIELLLFEFSPRSILPVALACITGAAGHYFLFEAGPVFPMPAIATPGNEALAVYSGLGLITGLIAAAVTRSVYAIEDAFEKLPIHWMWWPALGGLAVGLMGFLDPRTLGVGYDNITHLLSGKMVFASVLSLCVWKFLSWSIALGSGTSGGTLAPLLTIGGALGFLLGSAAIYLFPGAGISLPLAALVGMSALFAGASRALLTSLIFALETTGQAHALLPLLAACIASYFVSYLLMKHTIMTEKIARRGVHTPHSYEPDVLEKIRVNQVQQKSRTVISAEASLREVRQWLMRHPARQQNFYVVAGENGQFRGIVSASSLFSMHHSEEQQIAALIRRKPFAITEDQSLKQAVDAMARENLDVLPVVRTADGCLTGILTYRDVLSAYRERLEEHEEQRAISLKRRTLKILVRGKRKLVPVKENG